MLNFFQKKKEEEYENVDFTRQYLEVDQQKSNIYFHLEQQARARRKARGLIREKMIRRFFLLFSALAAVFVFVIIFSLFQHGSGPVHYTFNQTSFKDIISGTEALADFRFQKALLSFTQSEKEALPQNKSFTFSALALNATKYFSSSAETVPDINQALLTITNSLSHGYQTLLTLSPDTFFASSTTQPAGILLAEAKAEIQGAHEKLLHITKPGIWQEMTSQEQYHVNTAFVDIPIIQENYSKITPAIDFLTRLFNPQEEKKILVLFQNLNIPRSSGGYIDAVGVVSISGGAITNISFDTIENLDGQLLAKIIPPVQLQNRTTSWGMRDVNWFLNFPTTATKAASLYRKSGGDAVDGVVVLDEELLADLFRVAGSITVFANEVNADNVLSLLRAHTQKQQEKNIPITVLNEATPLLFKKLSTLSEDDVSSLFHMFTDALSRKNMMAWFADSELQKIISQAGWDGKVLSTSNTNYVAFSAYDIDEDMLPYPLSQDILVQTDIVENGDIINTVAVQLQRHGDDASQSGDDSQYYTKLYVPKGSQLIAVSGGTEQSIVPQIDYATERFMPDEDVYASEATLRSDHANKMDIFEESGKTVFGTYVTPGSKGGKLLYHYKLPFTYTDIQDTFISTFQKQPGSHGIFQFSLLVPDEKKIIASDENPFDGEFSGAFARDLTFSAQIK